MLYKNIFKWLLVFLFIVGIITAAFGFINGWPETKEWKNDVSVAASHPDEIDSLKRSLDDRKLEIMTEKEVAELQPEIEALEEKLDSLIERIPQLETELNDAEKVKRPNNKQKEILETYPCLIDSLKATFDSLNVQIPRFNASKGIYTKTAELEASEERLATADASIDTILYSAYGMVVLAVLALFIVIFIITGINNPLGLVKLLVTVLVIGIIVYVAWTLAPGDPIKPEEYYIQHDKTAPSVTDLKLTDTVIYLAYLLIGCTFISLIVSWVVSAIRK